MFKRYRKIIVPLDGSAFAEQILPYLQRLNAPDETQLFLVHVVDPSYYMAASTRYAPPNIAQLIFEGGETYIAEQRTKLQSEGYQVEGYVLYGEPMTAILQVAQETNAELIAMTTHGRSGFVRWALGSVAERLVRATPLPVFLVREAMEPTQKRLRRILVPLDGSSLAEQALAEATALAQATGAELLLLQVIQALDEGSQRLLFPEAAAAEATLTAWQQEAEDYLQPISQRLQAQGVKVTHRVLTGNVVQTIINTADETGSDLLVMSTHGRSGLKRWIYGSIANRVLRGVNCPLLLLHDPQTPVDA